MNNEQLKELASRTNTLLSTGNTMEQAAVKISAEFDATAFVSKGKLWASYKDGKGQATSQVLA